MLTRQGLMGTTVGALGAVTLPIGSQASAQSAIPAKNFSPMIKMTITIKRRNGMTQEEFVRYQREVHRPFSCPSRRRVDTYDASWSRT